MGNQGSTPLHKAANDKDLSKLRWEVQQRPTLLDVQEQSMGWTALHVAAANGSDAIVRELLARSGRHDIADKEGRTPLHLAAMNGHLDAVRDLLRRGASTSVRDKSGKAPYDYAVQRYPSVAALLGGPPPAAPPPPPPPRGAIPPVDLSATPSHQLLPIPSPTAPPAAGGAGGAAFPRVPYEMLPAQTLLPPPPTMPTAPHPAGPAAAHGAPMYNMAWYGSGGAAWPQAAPAPPQQNQQQHLGHYGAPPQAPVAPTAPPPPGHATGAQANAQQGYLPYPSVPGVQPQPQRPPQLPVQPSWPGGNGNGGGSGGGGPAQAAGPYAAAPLPQQQQQQFAPAAGDRDSSGRRSGSGNGITAPVRPAADLDWAPSVSSDWGGEPDLSSPAPPGTARDNRRRGAINPIASARYQLERLLGAGLNQLAMIAGGGSGSGNSGGGGGGAGERVGGVIGGGSDASATSTASRFPSSVSGSGGRMYSYEQLRAATGGFSAVNKLGEGGYGAVYRGSLDGIPVAIKVMDTSEGCMQGRAEFEAEVAILSSLHHPHVVLLIGSCPERGMLVYELMTNSSLEAHLFAPPRPMGLPGQGVAGAGAGWVPLGWRERVKIAAEVASALLFLHTAPTPIVHMDLKPANILLDDHKTAKLGDVGLARLCPGRSGLSPRPGEAPTAQDTRLVGTFEYMDPEYLRTGHFSERSDVYALGMVMLQLLTGREGGQVVPYVEEARRDTLGFSNCIDPRVGPRDPWPAAEAAAFADLALRCVQQRPQDRPDLRTVILPTLMQLRQRTQLYSSPSHQQHPQHSQQQQQLAGADDVPQMFICPITQDVMDDPVVAADGYTYERLAIQEWMRRAPTSPLTNMPLASTALLENRLLRSAIREWRERTEGPAAAPQAPAAAQQGPVRGPGQGQGQAPQWPGPAMAAAAAPPLRQVRDDSGW